MTRTVSGLTRHNVLLCPFPKALRRAKNKRGLLWPPLLRLTHLCGRKQPEGYFRPSRDGAVDILLLLAIGSHLLSTADYASTTPIQKQEGRHAI